MAACEEVVGAGLRAVRQLGKVAEVHNRSAPRKVASEPAGGVAHVRVAKHVRVETDIDLTPLYRNVEHVRDGLPARKPVPHARDRHYEDRGAGGPRRGDDREGLLDALDEDHGYARVVYQFALARMH